MTNEEKLKELKRKLSGAHDDAFYSSIPNPVTPEDVAHNKSISDEIASLEKEIKELEDSKMEFFKEFEQFKPCDARLYMGDELYSEYLEYLNKKIK